MKKENIKKVGIVVLLLAILLLAGGITYAFFSSGIAGEQEKLTVTTGTLSITFSDNNTGITASTLNIGESTTKEFKIENTGSLDVTTSVLWENLINTFTDGSFTYTFQYKTSESSEWVTTPLASGNVPQSLVANDYNLAIDITVPTNTTYYYKLMLTYNYLTDTNQTSDTNAVLTSNFKIGNKIEEPALVTLAALGKTLQFSTPDFSSVATTDETSSGLYAMEDDYGTSYYYRGAVTDNYVKFAGFYWRIIRVNGDGSLRMIYDGTVAHSNRNGASMFLTTGVDGSALSSDRFVLTSEEFNPSNNDNAYVGYMYGTAGSSTYSETHTNTNNSTIKGLIDSWYSTNLSSYAAYIADAIYCNDRSIPGSSVTGWSNDTGLGYAKNTTGYGAAGRLVDVTSWSVKSPTSPKFTCSQKDDAFTVSDTMNGNGKLTYPVGLITVDEISAAGGVYWATNYYYYLSKASDYWYWSLSPSVMYNDGYAYVFAITSEGFLLDVTADDKNAVAPVISLKPEYAAQLEGSGTADDPFYIPNVA